MLKSIFHLLIKGVKTKTWPEAQTKLELAWRLNRRVGGRRGDRIQALKVTWLYVCMCTCMCMCGSWSKLSCLLHRHKLIIAVFLRHTHLWALKLSTHGKEKNPYPLFSLIIFPFLASISSLYLFSFPSSKT